MLRNYLVIAIRSLLKNKVFSIINILGLSLGMAFTIIILLWIQDELSYDKFHVNHDRIYHTYLRVYAGNTPFNFQPTTSPVIGKAMLNEIPEIVMMTRMRQLGELAFKAGDNLFIERGGFGADPELFNMFSYLFIHGHPGNALAGIYSIVLTEDMAEKYFGKEDPMGKTMRINNRIEVTVTAVIKNVPLNSHRQFDFLVPFNLCRELGIDIDETGHLFANCGFHTYVMLGENTDHEAVKEKVPGRFFFDEDIRGEAFLVPLPKTNRFSLVGGDLLIYLFLIIGMLVLAIACINYMNLSTAKATVRIKEVGIRKVFGASRRNLFRQFMGESFLYSLISLNFAIIIATLFMPVLNRLTGKEISLNYLDPKWIIILLGIWLVTGFLSGAYPSLLLASRRPVMIFQQHQNTRLGRSITRKILVITQFIFTALFLISMVVVNRQFFYMDHTDRGYDSEGLIYLQLRDFTREKSNVLKEDLLTIPGISAITNTSHLPVLISGGYFQVWGQSDEEQRYLIESAVDYDYIHTLGVEMELGRFYSEEYSTDSINAVVVNETAIKTLGWEEPLGRQFLYRDKYYPIIGVMKDFHHMPLLIPISPIVFTLHPERNSYLLIRLDKKDEREMKGILEMVESSWKEIFPELPVEYNFVDDYQFPQERTLYTAEQLMWYFTFLAILISIMGLYGLSTFMAERKTREIGIRKAMGAGTGRIVGLFSREYLKIILFSLVISWSLAVILLRKLLDLFAYSIGLSIWFFVGTGLFICLLVILTVGFQAWQSAVQNPADTLRHE